MAGIAWQYEISIEDVLALRIRQLEQKSEDIEVAKAELKNARLKNKKDFVRGKSLKEIGC